MLVEANQKFFENNYREFVHLQYLSEIMKLIPDVITPDKNQDRVDRFEISVDENGEHPIKIVGVDKDGNKTELEYKPEITDRVNELIRQNIHVLRGDTDKEWEQINFVKNPEHNYFEVECKLKDGNTVNTVIPNMTADDLKQINQIKAYDKKIVIKYLEEDAQGTLVEHEKVYNFDLYVTKEELNTELQDIRDTLANIGEIHQLSDKACSYSCDNHPGKQGYCTLFNIGETGKVLVNFAISFHTCLNLSLVAGETWTVNCDPIDLTNGQVYTGNYNDEQTIVEILYDDGTMHYVDATTNMRSTTFTVPADAQRGHIKKAWIRDQILFTPKV